MSERMQTTLIFVGLLALALFFLILWTNIRIVHKNLLTKRSGEHRQYYQLLKKSINIFQEMERETEAYYDFVQRSMQHFKEINDSIELIKHIEREGK